MNDFKKYNLRFYPYRSGMKVPECFCYDKKHCEIVDFFNHSAAKCVREFVSKVFVIRDGDDNFLGFIALSLCSLEKRKLKSDKAIGLFERPAVRIGQLIVDERYLRKGYGTGAINFVISIVRFFKAYLPCRLLVVDAIDDKAKTFYENRGFRALPDDKYTLVKDLAPILRKV